jgi:hypothetical protein
VISNAILGVPAAQVLVESPKEHRRYRIDSAVEHLLQVSTHKSLSKPEGSWSVVLRPERHDGRPWHELIHPNDLVSIALGYTRESTRGVMTGLVDQVMESDVIQPDGRRVRACHVQGRDLAKLFTEYRISNSFAINEANAYDAANLTFTTEAFSGNPEVPVMVREIFAALRKIRFPRLAFTPWQSAEGGYDWLSLIDLAVSSPYHVAGDVAPMYSGNVWNLLREVGKPPFHEVFLDQGSLGKQVLTIRVTPYSQLDALPVKAISEDAWTQCEFGRSDAEVINVAFVQLRIFGQSSATFAPAIDAGSLALFGVRDIRVPSNILARQLTPPKPDTLPSQEEKEAQDKANIGVWEELQRLLLAWYARADQLYSGTLTQRGDPEWRIGTCAYLKSRRQRFYVEGVQHTAHFGERPSFTTALRLTRGHSVDLTDR